MTLPDGLLAALRASQRVCVLTPVHHALVRLAALVLALTIVTM